MTRDDNWIVDKPVLIPEEVTVTVTEGTQIQFFSEAFDESNPQPGIQLEGTLMVNGTLKEPVSFLLSDLHQEKSISITTGGSQTGRFDFNYAIFENPFLAQEFDASASTISHCDFIITKEADGIDLNVYAKEIKYSKFTSKKEPGIENPKFQLSGSIEKCGILGVGITTGNSCPRITHSVFRNSQTNLQKHASYEAGCGGFHDPSYSWAVDNISSFEGKNYFRLTLPERNFIDNERSKKWDLVESLAAALEGNLAVINSLEEANFLASNYGGNNLGVGDYTGIGLRRVRTDTQDYWTWANGLTSDFDFTSVLAPSYQETWGQGSSTFFEDQQVAIIVNDGFSGDIVFHNLRYMVVEAGADISEQDIQNLPEEIPVLLNNFKNNAILQNWAHSDPASSFSLSAEEKRENSYYFTENYWGTGNVSEIRDFISDRSDNFNLGTVILDPILEEPPENTWPFVTDVILKDAQSGVPLDVVGAQEVLFEIHFNRDMNPEKQPAVSFGPDMNNLQKNIVEGDWVDARTWAGTLFVNPINGDGIQFLRLAKAQAADDTWLDIGEDEGRFRFQVASARLEGLALGASSGPGYIDLAWTQNDFELLAGYNLYRSEFESGPFTRINSTVIPGSAASCRDSSTS